MALEDLLAEVASRGLRLNNLFELPGGGWQANLTDGERFWEFGKGDTAIAALRAALYKQSTTTPVLGIKQSTQVFNLSASEKARILAGSL